MYTCRILHTISEDVHLKTPHQESVVLHSTGNHKQNEKTTHRMGENICKQSNLQGISCQNIQIAHGTQHQNKKHNPIKK